MFVDQFIYWVYLFGCIILEITEFVSSLMILSKLTACLLLSSSSVSLASALEELGVLGGILPFFISSLSLFFVPMVEDQLQWRDHG